MVIREGDAQKRGAVSVRAFARRRPGSSRKRYRKPSAQRGENQLLG